MQLFSYHTFVFVTPCMILPEKRGRCKAPLLDDWFLDPPWIVPYPRANLETQPINSLTGPKSSNLTSLGTWIHSSLGSSLGTSLLTMLHT